MRVCLVLVGFVLLMILPLFDYFVGRENLVVVLILFSIMLMLAGVAEPQIKKTTFKQYEKPKDGKRRLTKEGYCYYYFWSRVSPKGFKIPFTLRITKIY